MIRLRIDSVVCDLAAEQPLTLAWSGRTLTDPFLLELLGEVEADLLARLSGDEGV